MPAVAKRQAKRVRIPTHYPTSGRATVQDAMKFLKKGRTKFYELIKPKTGSPKIASFKDEGIRMIEWKELWRYHKSLASKRS